MYGCWVSIRTRRKSETTKTQHYKRPRFYKKTRCAITAIKKRLTITIAHHCAADAGPARCTNTIRRLRAYQNAMLYKRSRRKCKKYIIIIINTNYFTNFTRHLSFASFTTPSSSTIFTLKLLGRTSNVLSCADRHTIITKEHCKKPTQTIKQLKREILQVYPKEFTKKLTSNATGDKANLTILRQLLKAHKKKLLSHREFQWDAKRKKSVALYKYKILA